MDFQVTDERAWEGEETYTLKIINNKTGEEISSFPSVRGGAFIVNATPFNQLATDQAVFGNTASVALSLYKLPLVMKDVVKRQPEIAAILTALEQAAGEPWGIK